MPFELSALKIFLLTSCVMETNMSNNNILNSLFACKQQWHIIH